ncbi:hypothetical protein N7470_002625, partial [Penicillium chermesinum]
SRDTILLDYQENTPSYREILPYTVRTLDRLLSTVVEALWLTLERAPYLFSSFPKLEGLDQRLSRRPISSKQELEIYKQFAIKEHIFDIITELCKLLAAREKFALGDKIHFSNHTNSLNKIAAPETDTSQPSNIYHLRPDQFYIHHINDNTSTLLTSIEYKPPHKLSIAILCIRLRPIDL